MVIPAAMLLGKWDYKRGAMKNDLHHTAGINPFNQDLARAFIWLVISTNRWGDEEKELVARLRKWSEYHTDRENEEPKKGDQG